MKSVDEIITEVLQREGWPAYTNDPADRGGPTKGGITLGSWRDHTSNPYVTAEHVKNITEEQARAFYRHRYIIDPGFDRIEDVCRKFVATVNAELLYGADYVFVFNVLHYLISTS